MKKRGRGIACMWYPIGFTVAANPSAATVKLNEDGTAVLLTGTVETGQGALTVLAQIAAEGLGIATDDVHVVSADTDTTPMDTGAIWQELYRSNYFEGGRVLCGAISAIDIALHDSKGKALGVPVYQLLGGKQRDHVPHFSTTSARTQHRIAYCPAPKIDTWPTPGTRVMGSLMLM